MYRYGGGKIDFLNPENQPQIPKGLSKSLYKTVPEFLTHVYDAYTARIRLVFERTRFAYDPSRIMYDALCERMRIVYDRIWFPFGCIRFVFDSFTTRIGIYGIVRFDPLLIFLFF